MIHRAKCKPCNWSGPDRQTMAWAVIDKRGHQKDCPNNNQ